MAQLETIGLLVLEALAIRVAVLGLALLTDVWIDWQLRNHPLGARNTPELEPGLERKWRTR